MLKVRKAIIGRRKLWNDSQRAYHQWTVPRGDGAGRGVGPPPQGSRGLEAARLSPWGNCALEWGVRGLDLPPTRATRHAKTAG